MEIEKLTYKHLSARIGRRKTKRLRPSLTINHIMAFNEFSQNHESFNQYIEGRHSLTRGCALARSHLMEPCDFWDPCY